MKDILTRSERRRLTRNKWLGFKSKRELKTKDLSTTKAQKNYGGFPVICDTNNQKILAIGKNLDKSTLFKMRYFIRKIYPKLDPNDLLLFTIPIPFSDMPNS